MNYATGDANVIISADLQDPPELIPQMFEHWVKGIKFVIANRQDREESFSQKLFSNTYHNLIKKYALPHIPKGGFDLVLFDKQLRESVVKVNERNTNTIYLLAWLNYEYVTIPYVRRKRDIGKSRWTLKKKIKLFIDSFVSFSFMPIRAITVLGFLFGFLAFIYGSFVIVSRLLGNVPIEGWSSLMIVILFVASFQMIAIGIIGEYVWRTLDAARGRPNFVVDQVK
jgi:dolichol-phosphate mannosyltransferase